MIPVPGDVRSSISSFQEASNWSGYDLTGSEGAFTAVTGCWAVPQVPPSSEDTYSSSWIGIDGVVNEDLIQTGTEQDGAGVPPCTRLGGRFCRPARRLSAL